MARHYGSSARPALMLGLCVFGMAALVQVSAASTGNLGDTSSGQAIPEVTVTGKMNSRALDHAINQFVQTHAKPSALIGQLGRWNMKVCPVVTGLQDAAAEVVTRRIESVARSIGAPTPASDTTCSTNVEIEFTDEPQALLDHVAAMYPLQLGYYRDSDRKQVTTFSHPVQAWYMTGTRSIASTPPVVGSGGAACVGCDVTGIITTGLQLDSVYTDGSLGLGASGTLEKRFTRGFRSEFIHILIIVDNTAVAKHSLSSVADYVALLALTRIGSQDSCSGLSSILTLFDTNCGEPPAALTGVDTAYLKALYAADLDMNLNIEQGDMRQRMRKVIASK